MESDVRLVQLARLLGLDRATITARSARDAAASQPTELAASLAGEASANDDITSRGAALDYLESRLSYFDDLFTAATADRVRAEFGTLVDAW